MYYLRLVREDGAEEVVRLSGKVRLGREIDNDVVLDDYDVSRHHAEIEYRGGGLFVRDLGSRNGTFLNTLPASNTKVHTGDEIRAGVNRFKVEVR